MVVLGRPKKEIDWGIFEELCNIQCTQAEIASVLKVHHETLEIKIKENYEEPYLEVYKRFSAGGKSSLRRKQYKVAMDGNVSMLIWLGKQFLDQKEPQISDGNKVLVITNSRGKMELDVAEIDKKEVIKVVKEHMKNEEKNDVC